MNQNSKRLLIVFLDVICGFTLSLFFSNYLTKDYTKIIACCTWIGILIIRLVLDWLINTPEESYYKSIQDQLQNKKTHNLEMQKEIHKKMVVALQNGNISEVVTLQQLDERFGIK